MSEYRWEGSPYQPTPHMSKPAQEATERLYRNLETMSRALIRIALGNESQEYMQHIAAQALMEAGECQSQKKGGAQ